jgi:hypothetical protein
VTVACAVNVNVELASPLDAPVIVDHQIATKSDQRSFWCQNFHFNTAQTSNPTDSVADNRSSIPKRICHAALLSTHNSLASEDQDLRIQSEVALVADLVSHREQLLGFDYVCRGRNIANELFSYPLRVRRRDCLR